MAGPQRSRCSSARGVRLTPRDPRPSGLRSICRPDPSRLIPEQDGRLALKQGRGRLVVSSGTSGSQDRTCVPVVVPLRPQACRPGPRRERARVAQAHVLLTRPRLHVDTSPVVVHLQHEAVITDVAPQLDARGLRVPMDVRASARRRGTAATVWCSESGGIRSGTLRVSSGSSPLVHHWSACAGGRHDFATKRLTAGIAHSERLELPSEHPLPRRNRTSEDRTHSRMRHRPVHLRRRTVDRDSAGTRVAPRIESVRE